MSGLLAIKDRFSDSESIRKGLSLIEDYPSNACAVFDFQFPHILRFWGKDLLFPIDIMFIRKDGTVDSIKQIEPLDVTPVSSDSNCVVAVEANRGAFEKYEDGEIVSIQSGYMRF